MKLKIGEKIGLLVFFIIFAFGLWLFCKPNPDSDKMQIFPSYDWGSEDEEFLAYIAANTNGSDRNKQQAIIDCLDYVWNANHHFDIPQYASAKYKFYIEPTKHDYELVNLVKKGEWATDD